MHGEGGRHALGSARQDYYLLDIARGRFEAPELRAEMLACNEAWIPTATLVENTELGRSLAQDFRRHENWRIGLRTPRYDKQARLLAQLARFEAGQVQILRNAAWRSVYEQELLAFPRSEHTDQVDATSQALDYFSSLIPRDRSLKRRNIKRKKRTRADVEGGPP